jgi:hypothetical protein
VGGGVEGHRGLKFLLTSLQCWIDES